MAGWGSSGCRPAIHREGRRPAAPPPPLRPLRVVASTAMVADLVRDVGGEGVEVVVLLPHGEPAASLERTGPGETEMVLADLVVLLGLGQEAVLAPSLARAAEAGASICELAGGVPASMLFASREDPERPDPHVWLDPRVWREAIDPLEDSLIRLRPEAGAEWRRRAHLVRFELEEAAAAMERVARAGLPPEPVAIRTGQPGLRYLARAVGVPLELVAGEDAAVDQDDLEKLPLDRLQVPGTAVVSGLQEHDLGTLGGLRGHALDLLLRRYQ